MAVIDFGCEADVGSYPVDSDQVFVHHELESALWRFFRELVKFCDCGVVARQESACVYATRCCLAGDTEV